MKKFLTLITLFASTTVLAQPVGSPAQFTKSATTIDTKTYYTATPNTLYSINGAGSFALIAKSTFLTPADGNAAYSLLGHTHTFASITSKPTTLAGYGITDGLTQTAADALYMPLDPDVASQVLDVAADPFARTSVLASYVQDGGALSTGLFFPSYGLSIRDNAASQFLSIGVGEDLTANRQLTLLVDNANRTLEINGDAELSGVNTGDQDLSGFSLLGHTHLSADVTDASTGGNTTSDAGLLAKYSTQGQLHGSVVNSSTAAVWGSTSGSGYAGFFSGGSGGSVILSSPTAAGAFSSSLLPLEATNISSGDIAHFNALSGKGLEVNNDGSLTWTSATGASGTRTGLGLGALSTVTPGTGVAAALAINTGSAGAPVLFNGAGGTPSSLTGTNITGTASGLSIGGNAATATSLATGRTIAITGDLAYTSPSFNGSSNVTAAGTLATVNSNVGTFGSATEVAQVTLNGKGLATAATNVTVTPAVGSITGLGTGVATALANNADAASGFVTQTGGDARYGLQSNLPHSVLTADFVTTSTSLVDVTGTAGALVTMTLAANATYRFTSDVIYQSAATATGCRVAFSATNSPTIVLQQSRFTSSAAANVASMITTSDGGAASATSVVDAATDLIVLTRGLIITGGSASVVTLRVLRGGNANNITVKTGSMIMAVRLQ